MGAYERKKDSRSAGKSYIGSGFESEPAKLLAAHIVIHAIGDWRELVKHKAWRQEPRVGCNFDELRAFFKGEWCDFLLQDLAVEPARILETLEAELVAAQEKEERRKCKN